MINVATFSSFSLYMLNYNVILSSFFSNFYQHNHISFSNIYIEFSIFFPFLLSQHAFSTLFRYRQPSKLPVVLQGNYKNDFLGQVFDPLTPGDPKLTGEYIIRNIFGISLDHSKWLDLLAVFVLLISYRILFFLVLKFNEMMSPIFRDIYARATLKHMMRRASFRISKGPSFSSARHQPLHPMAMQEGLGSPLP